MDELADLLADGDPFSIERTARGAFVVAYDDVIAHEHADAVVGSVEALGAVPGVHEVVHEDREVLLVRAAEDVTEGHLDAALRSFWRRAAASPVPTRETLKGLAASAAPLLKREGFRKQGLRWNREPAPGFVHVIELGRAEEGEGYVGTVDIALYDEETGRRRGLGTPARFVAESDGQVRQPSGSFALTPDATPLLALLELEVLPLLARVTSRRDVLAEEWRDALFGPIDRAIMLALEGEATTARDLLQDRFDHLRRARRHLHDVVAACGLPPLATGRSGDRTPAEEALLPAWLATEADAAEHLRRAFAQSGGDPRFLDGTAGSLDALHDRWRDLVGRAQLDRSSEATALMALPTGTWSRYDHRPPADVRPSPAARRLTEGLACYLAEVIRRRVPTVQWQIAETSSGGFEPVLTGPPAGPADVVKRSIDLLDAALRPLTAEQQRLFRRYNPMRAEVDRWLAGAPSEATGKGFLGRFRRG